MALAAQLQQDEYDADEQARHRQTSNSHNRRDNVQFAPSTSDSSATRSNNNNNSQDSASYQDQAQSRRSTGGTRPEDLDPKVLHGLGARSAKKQKEKEKSGDKKNKKDCIIC